MEVKESSSKPMMVFDDATVADAQKIDSMSKCLVGVSDIKTVELYMVHKSCILNLLLNNCFLFFLNKDGFTANDAAANILQAVSWISPYWHHFYVIKCQHHCQQETSPNNVVKQKCGHSQTKLSL